MPNNCHISQGDTHKCHISHGGPICHLSEGGAKYHLCEGGPVCHLCEGGPIYVIQNLFLRKLDTLYALNNFFTNLLIYAVPLNYSSRN